MRLEGELGLWDKLMRLDSVTSEGIMTNVCATAVDALRALSRHLCARNLVEEFICAKVLPLRAGQAWFMVKDDEKYRARGLKGLSANVRQAWLKVLQKSNKSATRVKTVYKKVSEAIDELIEALGT
jgi:hypothetical protein